MIVRERKKQGNCNSYAFVGIVIMVLLAIISTNLTFAGEDPSTWVQETVSAEFEERINDLMTRYRDESYPYYHIQVGSNSNYITLFQSMVKPYVGATSFGMWSDVAKIPEGNTDPHYTLKTERYYSGTYPSWLDNLEVNNDQLLITGFTSQGSSVKIYPLLKVNYDLEWADGTFIVSGNVSNDLANGIGGVSNPIITYTNTELTDVTFNLWSNSTSNITILEPTKWINTATIGTSKIPFTMTPNETIKIRWNNGDDFNYNVITSETIEYVSNSITTGETFTYTNNTGIEQDIRIFADNGIRAVIRLIQNIKTITPPTVETIPVLPNQTITFVVLEGSVTAKISDYTPIEEPQIYDASKVLNILSPNNNTITALNDITIRFTVERPRLENPQIQFKLNNQQSWYPLEFSEQGFRVEDNSTITTIKRTYEVPIRLLGDQINNLRIRVINAGMVTQEETVSIIHKSFEDDGTGLDVVTGEVIDPTQMPPLDGNENDLMGIPDEDDYEDSIFGQVKYLADTITNAITMPFRFIGEALVHISDWFIESAGWIGTMNDIMRGFIGFVPTEIQDAILVLIYATVIFSVFALMRK